MRFFLLAVVLLCQCTGNRCVLYISRLLVPDPLLLDSFADLTCEFSWNASSKTRSAYSVKWYKDGKEFYRFVPSESPAIVSFPHHGPLVDESLSNLTRVRLTHVDWASAGSYRCEVTADDFETVTSTTNVIVVATPRRGPTISVEKVRYSVGEMVDVNCTSNSSDPLPKFFWYINSEPPLPSQVIEYPWRREVTNLMTKTVGLRFRVFSRHIQPGFRVHLKCTLMLPDVFLRSQSLELEVERPKRTISPPLESRPGISAKDMPIEEKDDFAFDAGDERQVLDSSSIPRSVHKEEEARRRSFFYGSSDANSKCFIWRWFLALIFWPICQCFRDF